MQTTVPERERFLRAILADPEDDFVRLVFADWLDEHGEVELGEFIRVQIELANWKIYQAPSELRELADSGRLYAHHARQLIAEKVAQSEERFTTLCRRERELLGVHKHEWFGHVINRKAWPLNWDYRFRRGFVEGVTLAAEGWVEHGREICRVAPVRKVALADKSPSCQRTESPHWSNVISSDRCFLPTELYSRLTWGTQTAFYKTYRSRELALEDLSEACLRYAKG